MICGRCGCEIPDGSEYCNKCGKKQSAVQRKRVRGNGQGTVYKLPSGKWKAVITLGYTDNAKRKTLSRVYRTKSEAIAALPGLSAREKPSPRMAELFEKWSEKHYPDITPNKRIQYNTAWKRLEPLRFCRIDDLITADLQGAVEQAEGYYPRRDIKTVLSGIYQYALQNNLASRDYAQYIALPPMPKSDTVPLTEREIQAIWQEYNSGNDFARYLLIMIYTGLRTGEVRNILPENIHPDYLIAGSKTKAGRNRVIPLPDIIKPLLKDPLPKISEPLFYRRFAGLKQKCALRDEVTPYSCRHTAATALVEAGVKPAIVQRILGHARFSTTVDIYTHLPDKDLIDAVKHIGQK